MSGKKGDVKALCIHQEGEVSGACPWCLEQKCVTGTGLTFVEQRMWLGCCFLGTASKANQPSVHASHKSSFVSGIPGASVALP